MSACFAPPNVFVQRGRHRFFLGGVLADAAGFLDQLVINRQVGRHSKTSLYV